MTIQDNLLHVAPAKGISYFTPAQEPASGTIADSADDVPQVFQPLRIRGLELQNRIMV